MPEPDDLTGLTREQLADKVRTARVEFGKLRQEVKRLRAAANDAAAQLIRAKEEEAARAELLALVRGEKEQLKEQLAAAGRDNRLVQMVAEARERHQAQAVLLDALGAVLNGDAPLPAMPDHPLLNTATEVTALAGTNVSWRRVADRRYELLDELVTQYDAASGRPSSPDWVRLVNRIRTELQERIDL